MQNIKVFSCNIENHQQLKLRSMCTFPDGNADILLKLSCSNCIKDEIQKQKQIIYLDFPDSVLLIKEDLFQQAANMKINDDIDQIEVQYLNLQKYILFLIEQLKDHQKALNQQMEVYKEKRIVPKWEDVLNQLFDKLDNSENLQAQRDSLSALAKYFKADENRIYLNQEYIEKDSQLTKEAAKKYLNNIEQQLQSLGKINFDLNKILEIKEDKQNENKFHNDQFLQYIELLKCRKALQENIMVKIQFENQQLKNQVQLLKNNENQYMDCIKFINDTVLVKNDNYLMLREWFSCDLKLVLIYRASIHGFASQNFHQCCDGKGPNIVVIRSENGNLFGGYCSQGWNSNGGYFGDNDSFLFSITHKQKLKYINKEQFQQYGDPKYGPIFGAGHDIYISSNSNSNLSSYSNLGHSYFCPVPNQKQQFLAGSYNFKVSEIEVFKLRLV